MHGQGVCSPSTPVSNLPEFFNAKKEVATVQTPFDEVGMRQNAYNICVVPLSIINAPDANSTGLVPALFQISITVSKSRE